MELPKLLQQHSEKENRPIEVQLNEAKKRLFIGREIRLLLEKM